MVNATELQRPDRGTIGGSAGCRDYPMSTHGTEGNASYQRVAQDRVLVRRCSLSTRHSPIRRTGQTRRRL